MQLKNSYRFTMDRPPRTARKNIELEDEEFKPHIFVF